MKKIVLVVLVPLVIAATAAASPNPASATAQCENLKRKSPELFAPTSGAPYASIEACVAAKTAEAAKAKTEAAGAKSKAATACKAAKEKSNGKSKNVKAKCASSTPSASTVAKEKAKLNAAKLCKAERADANFKLAHDQKTFAEFYGKNKNLKNAFGKCVSMHAKAKHS